MVFQFRVMKDEITPFIKRFGKEAPIALGRGLFKTAKYGQRMLRRELTRQGLIHTKGLWNKTEARFMSKRRSVIFIPQYGLNLDSMKPHWVSLKRGRNITFWARDAPNSPWRGNKPNRLPRAIYVKPHPWIETPIQKTENKSLEIINNELNKVFR